MNVYVAAAVGQASTELAAFDAALLATGVANFNLIRLSSVIPPSSDVVRVERCPFTDDGTWGDRLYAVYAAARTSTPGDEVWAGVGWVQEPVTRRGLLVEHEGHSESEVRELIRASLVDLQRTRGLRAEAIEMCVTGAVCDGTPTCAFVVCGYATAPWPHPVGVANEERRTAGDEFRDQVVAADELVPTMGGSMVRYVNLDNAATTPAMRSVLDAVAATVPHYSSVHRGAGHHARRCTEAFEDARRSVGEFVAADPDRDTVVFTKNTTEAINKLAAALPLDDDSVILTTILEHHSNDLPWRARVRTVHIGAQPDGTLDLDDLDRQLHRYAGRIGILVVSGASNVTGVIPPVHELASRVHAAGGLILVDAAQLAPHRPIDMRPHNDPGHLDFVALSAHKLYAPFGSGALVGRRDRFGHTPGHRGGGTVSVVTLDDVVWADLPEREEAGTPNLLGAVAFAAATRALREIGWQRIVAHESGLLARATAELARLPGVHLFGPQGADALASKVGVIPFTVDGLDHGLVSAILGYEHGIGVRSGCFCAQPYVAHLLGLNTAARSNLVSRARHGDRRGVPGMVRLSLGLYNDESDVDRIVDALQAIINGDISATYACDDRGEYRPTTEPPTTSPERDRLVDAAALDIAEVM